MRAPESRIRRAPLAAAPTLSDFIPRWGMSLAVTALPTLDQSVGTMPSAVPSKSSQIAYAPLAHPVGPAPATPPEPPAGAPALPAPPPGEPAPPPSAAP